jgi:hypothetical protein
MDGGMAAVEGRVVEMQILGSTNFADLGAV